MIKTLLLILLEAIQGPFLFLSLTNIILTTKKFMSNIMNFEADIFAFFEFVIKFGMLPMMSSLWCLKRHLVDCFFFKVPINFNLFLIDALKSALSINLCRTKKDPFNPFESSLVYLKQESWKVMDF